jgi:hypothetical protein
MLLVGYSCRENIFNQGSFVMLTDPISVAAAAPTPALSFTRVSWQGQTAVWKDGVNAYQLDMNHSMPVNGAEKHYLRITQYLTATNPITGGQSYQQASVSLSMSVPAFGWTAATKAALIKALTDTLNDAEFTVARFVNGEV